MQGHCANCGQQCDGQLLCPHCGIQLTDDGSNVETMPLPVQVAEEPSDGPSFGRRLTLGGIALLGLYHGLKHVVLAVALAYSTAVGFTSAALMGLLVAATLAASVVAGTANRRAELAGFLLGLAAAGGCIAQDLVTGFMPALDWLVGIPVLLAMVGAIGGLAGRLMVPPAPKVPKFGQFDLRRMKKAAKQSVPLVWWRIGFGTLLALVGTLYADSIRQALSHVLAGHGNSIGSARLLTWQVSVVFGILGGVAAGANTHGGLRQGMLAGFAAGTGVIVFESARKASGSLLMEFWAYQLDIKEIGLTAYAALGGGVLAATAIGGWLGEHLLPPYRKQA